MLHREPAGYALQPFEQRLAELEVMGAADPRQLAFASRVDGYRTHQYYFDRFWKLAPTPAASDLLSYAAQVSDGNRVAAHNYLTHGLHAYKGKFFPQIVRALTNYAGLGPEASVVDPFVGSGTTTLEAQLMGVDSYGIDKNPLAALIAETKVKALELDPDGLADAAREVGRRVGASRSKTLPNHLYLERWFPEATLRVVSRILTGIAQSDVPLAFKSVARLVLSTNLRGWSLQEPTQLRLFRRTVAPPAHAVAVKFSTDLDSTARDLALSIRLVRAMELPLGNARIAFADAREPDVWAGRVHDALITSPPYATALPYIDTDRLSIFALGLAETHDRSQLEWAMIGNREIGKRQRAELEAALQSNAAKLPKSICSSILKISRANQRAEVGFRRANLPALLYKYFWDMDTVISRAVESLRPDALCAIVVGDSYTTAGTKKVRIETGSHLIASAEAHGFRLEERIAMGGQMRYLPHQRNTIPNEEIIILRRR